MVLFLNEIYQQFEFYSTLDDRVKAKVPEYEKIAQLSQRSEDLNQLIGGQQQSLETVSASVTEMSASADEVSNNASVTASTTQQANEICPVRKWICSCEEMKRAAPFPAISNNGN